MKIIQRIKDWKGQGSYISNKDSCPLCSAGEAAHRMSHDVNRDGSEVWQEIEIWCTACESRWKFTGKEVTPSTGAGSYREYELVECPEDSSLVGMKRSGFDWSQMSNAMETDGDYKADIDPLFDIDEDANPLFTFSLGVVLAGFSLPVMGTGILFPVGILMLLVAPVLCFWGVIQFIFKPRDDD